MSMQATRLSFCVFLAFLRSFIVEVLSFRRFMPRSSSVSDEEDDLQSQKVKSERSDETEDSVFLHSEYQFVASSEGVSASMEEITETSKFSVRESFVGPNEARLDDSDQTENMSEESRQGLQFKFQFNSYSSPTSEDQDISYDVELMNPFPVSDSADSDSDDDYIVFERHKVVLHESDDDDGDVLKEHEELVRQMKMELKNCRIKGLLPTISEEEGSPEVTVEDLLKPFEFERKFEYKRDASDEIRIFHKIYAEKMRKLDVLNYQALHAISFIELTDKRTVKPRSKNRPSTPFSKFDKRKIYADSPTQHRSISEMRQDLELIYVGQLCLSWEILSWSYDKARELVEYESSNIGRRRSYNRVSEEFQQFQILLQRFVEDEIFQGERTTFYAKSRCNMRNLLQVPVIRDDWDKEMKQRTEEGDGISIETLAYTIRESMFIFRDFLFSDKKCTNKKSVLRKCDVKGSLDSRVLDDVIAALRTKEKRLGDCMRSESCIVKRLKRGKEREIGSKIEVVFMKSQVDLRLVSIVLSLLPRISNDQILWCKMKLDGIGFVGRKVHVEPSFLLFPC